MNITKTKIISSKGKLAVAIHRPKSKTKKLAILCPGYLDSKDYAHLVGLADVLCKNGYTVVRFDPTGTWESEGDISDYTTTQCIEDIKNILEYMLHETGYRYILLGGHSRGGMTSILYAARDRRVSVVLGIMPSSGRSMTKQRREEWKRDGVSISERDLPDNKSKKIKFRVPYSHVEDRDRYDVTRDVKKVTAPIVFIAGELDELVLPKDVKEIFDNANEPKKFVIVPHIGHNYRYNEKEIKAVNKIVIKQLDLF